MLDRVLQGADSCPIETRLATGDRQGVAGAGTATTGVRPGSSARLHRL